MNQSATPLPPERLSATDVAELGVVGVNSVAMAASMLHELSVTEYLHTPAFADGIPGIEHSSSVAGSIATVSGLMAATEWAAGRFERNGHDAAANRVRRWGLAAAVTGTVVCQTLVETDPRGGVSDKWDLATGLVSILPGIVSGNALARSIRNRVRAQTAA